MSALSFADLYIISHGIYALIYALSLAFFFVSAFLRRIKAILWALGSLMAIVALSYGLIDGLSLLEGALEFSLLLILLFSLSLLPKRKGEGEEEKKE